MRALLVGRPLEGQSMPPLTVGELPDPSPADGEVVLAVRATALNHADVLQVQGNYPPPAGESAVPGLECAGVVEAVGPGVTGWRPGDRVMALLGGGGHASRVSVPVGQLMALPENLTFEQGAALPEACLTAWTNLVFEGGLQAGETVLVTGATGGMGTMAVEIAHELGARVIAAGRSAARLEALCALGADETVVLDADVRAAIGRLTDGRGVDLVFDLVGGRWLPQLIECLALRGRLVIVGLLGGRTTELAPYELMRRRARLIGSVLRPRPREEKASLVRDFAAFGLPRLADGRLRAVVDQVMPFSEIAAAYAELARGGAAGKIVLTLA